MPFPWAAALGTAGSIWAGAQQNKAAKQTAGAIRYAADRGYNLMRELAAPGLKALGAGMKGLESVAGYYGGKLGRGSELLSAAHTENVGRIGRAGERGVESARSFWQSAGDPLRSRGEETRARESTIRATNVENLGHAGMQEEYAAGNLAGYQNVLARLMGGGMGSLGTAAQGIGMQAQGQMNAAGVDLEAANTLYGDLGTLFGIPIGDYLADQDWAMMQDTAGAKKKTSATPKTMSDMKTVSVKKTGGNRLNRWQYGQ